MGVSVVQYKTAQVSGTTPSITCTATGLGNTLVLFASTGNYSTNTTFTGPAGWNSLGAQNNDGYTFLTHDCWYLQNCPAGTTSVSITLNAAPAGATLTLVELAGAVYTSSLDASHIEVATAFATSKSWSVTTTQTGDALLAFLALDASVAGAPTVTQPGGWTAETPVTDTGGFATTATAFYVAGAAGAQTYNPSWSVNTDWTVYYLAFKAAAASGSTYDNTVLGETGIQAYYPLNEGSGTVAHDLKSNYNGTINGTVTLGATSLLAQDTETGMTFDGSTGYISLPSGLNPSGWTAFTVECWVNTTAQQNEYIVANATQAANSGFELTYWNATGSTTTAGGFSYNQGNGSSNGGAYAQTGFAVPLSTYHVVVSWNGSKVSMYVNGALQPYTESIAGMGAGGGVINIGGTSTLTTTRFKGTIQKVAIYNTALTQSKAVAHYTAGVTAATKNYKNTVLGDTPSRYYRLGDAVNSTTAVDSSTNAVTATVSSTAHVTFGQTSLLPGDTADTAVKFDGSGMISTTSTTGLPASGVNAAFTMECWLNYAGGGAATQVFFATGQEGSNAHKMDLAVTNGGQWFFTTGTDSAHLPISQSTWTHFVVTYDGGSAIQCYWNGIPISTISGALALTYGAGNSLTIGQTTNGTSYPLTGIVDDASVYLSKLTPAQVQTHYVAGLSNYAAAATRTLSTSAVFKSTPTRTLSTSANFTSSTITRTLATSAVLKSTVTRILATSAVMKKTATRTLATSASLSGAYVRTLGTSAAISYKMQPMPLISKNTPAYASNTTVAPSKANDGDYSTYWNSTSTPSVATPAYMAYDLSGVASANRGKVVVALYTDESSVQYYTGGATSLWKDYTIQVNSAAGGAYPASGWVTLVTVTSNNYLTRSHLIDMTGYNWVQFVCTAPYNNTSILLQMDVHDASLGTEDWWLFLGDSITARALARENFQGGNIPWGYGGALPQVINGMEPKWYPLTLNGGASGQTMSWLSSNVNTLISPFAGRYAIIAMGTNDLNISTFLQSNSSQISTYYSQLLTVIDACTAAGIIPVVPYIPWGNANNGALGYNANIANQYVNAHLPSDRPHALRGPDFWTYFNQNPGLISDGIHPGYTESNGQPSGLEAMHQLYANWMLTNVYSVGIRSVATSAVLKSTNKRTVATSANLSLRTRQLSTSAAVSGGIPYSVYDRMVMNETGLVAYYPLADTSGTTATDIKSGYNGTISGTVTLGAASLLAGDASTAMTFDGSTGYITLPAGLNPAGWGQLTLECWVSENVQSSGYIVANATQAANSGFELTMWNNGIQGAGNPSGMSFNMGNGSSNGGAYCQSASALPANKTFHVLVSWDGSTVTMYLNGRVQPYTESITALGNPGNQIQIAATPTGTTNRFNGTIQKVALYNTALSGARALKHYLSGVNPPAQKTYVATVLADSPSRYYRLNDAANSTTFVDSSPNAVTASLSTSGTVAMGQPGALGDDLTNTAATFNSTGFISTAYGTTTGLPVGGSAAGAFTVELWINTGNVPSAQPAGVFVGLGAESSANKFDLAATGSGPPTAFISSGAETGHAPYSANVWHHLVGVYDGASNYKLYLDGTFVASASGALTLNYTAYSMVLGNAPDGSKYPLNGSMDEVAIYTYALSAAQVQTHYIAGLSTSQTLSRSVPTSAILSGRPAPMPKISQGVPAYASDPTYPASNANDGNYATVYHSVSLPSVASPVYVAYDLSGVASASRSNIVVALYNELGGQYYNTNANNAISLFQDYTIEGNTAAGGTLPTSGWTTLVTVTGNYYPTRSHQISNFTGYNWIRFVCTASNGASPNNDVQLQMDVHDASKGSQDWWLFLGDSITNEDTGKHNIDGSEWGYGGTIAQRVNASASKYFPLYIDGGNSGMTMSWAATNVSGLLANYAGKYVVIAFGTNDFNLSYQVTAGGSEITTFYSNLLTVIDQALAANKIVVVPYIPYGTNNGGNLGYNANLANQYVDAHLPTDRPGVMRGPDFWTFFNQHTNLIRDGIHPTYAEVNGQPSGYEWQHQLYSNWMLTNVYGVPVRTLNTSAALVQAVASTRSVTSSASLAVKLSVARHAQMPVLPAGIFRSVTTSAALSSSPVRHLPTTALLAGTLRRTLATSAAVAHSKVRSLATSASMYRQLSVALHANLPTYVVTTQRSVTTSAVLLRTSVRQAPTSAVVTTSYARALTTSAVFKATPRRQVATSAATLRTLKRQAPATAALRGTVTRQVATSAALLQTSVHTLATSAAVLRTFTRQAPTSGVFFGASVRSVPTSVGLTSTLSRSVPTSARLVSTLTRSVATGAVLKRTLSRSAPTSAATHQTAARSVKTSAALRSSGLVRQASTSAALLSTLSRSVATSAVVFRGPPPVTRQLVTTAVFNATPTRTLATAGVLAHFGIARSVVTSAAIGVPVAHATALTMLVPGDDFQMKTPGDDLTILLPGAPFTMRGTE